MTQAAETTAVGAMIGSAVWTTITGDTFIPSCTGALFAGYLRAQARPAGLDRTDLVVGVVASIFIGLIAGPYVASQFPDGDGVLGVGALITSFMAIGFFGRLHELKWDFGALMKEFGGAIGKAISGGKKE